MRKNIKINGKTYKFKSSAAIPRMYRIKFGRDIFVVREEQFTSHLPIKSLELFENIAFLMNKHGDPSQPSDVDEWLEQFETFDIYSILPQIVDMWKLENQQMSKPKKEKGK